MQQKRRQGTDEKVGVLTTGYSLLVAQLVSNCDRCFWENTLKLPFI